MMIRLKNDFCIDADANQFKLCKTSIKHDSKTNRDEEVLVPIGFYSNLKDALNGYMNKVLQRQIQENDCTLLDVRKKLDELYEELGKYD